MRKGVAFGPYPDQSRAVDCVSGSKELESRSEICCVNKRGNAAGNHTPLADWSTVAGVSCTSWWRRYPDTIPIQIAGLASRCTVVELLVCEFGAGESLRGGVVEERNGE